LVQRGEDFCGKSINYKDTFVISSTILTNKLYYYYCLTNNTYINIYIYTGCFTTLGQNGRRWFPMSLWWKKFI